MKNLKITLLTLLALALSLSACAFGGDDTPTMSDETLKANIANMMIIGFRGTEATAESYVVKTIKTLSPGGIILFDYDGPSKSYPRNIINPAQTAALIKDIKAVSNVPLFVALDLEGGRVNRLKAKYGFADFPSAQQMGEKNDIEYTKSVSESIAVEISALGFNVNFAPVVDVNVNPANPVIGALGRSFSDSAEVVARHAAAFMDGHRRHNIINSLKHFPGHGSSTADSHLGMADVTATYKDIELIPYRELIKSGAMDMVMTAHIMNRNIDAQYPATLSPNFISKILRNELGYDGIVVSDDMHMAAITSYFGFEDSVVRAIGAGCDLLIISNNGSSYDEKAPFKAVESVFNAARSGRLPISVIVKANERINRLKAKYGIIK